MAVTAIAVAARSPRRDGVARGSPSVTSEASEFASVADTELEQMKSLHLHVERLLWVDASDSGSNAPVRPAMPVCNLRSSNKEEAKRYLIRAASANTQLRRDNDELRVLVAEARVLAARRKFLANAEKCGDEDEELLVQRRTIRREFQSGKRALHARAQSCTSIKRPQSSMVVMSPVVAGAVRPRSALAWHMSGSGGRGSQATREQWRAQLPPSAASRTSTAPSVKPEPAAKASLPQLPSRPVALPLWQRLSADVARTLDPMGTGMAPTRLLFAAVGAMDPWWTRERLTSAIAGIGMAGDERVDYAALLKRLFADPDRDALR